MSKSIVPPTPKNNQNQAIAITNHITIWASVLVIIAAAVLSFTALRDLFVSIGLFAAWLAFLFPLMFDLAEVAAAVSVLNAKLQGEEDRFAWRLVIGFTLAGIAANVAHAAHAWQIGRIDGTQLTLAIGATSLFPLSIALVTHLVKRTIERQINRAGHIATVAEMRQQISTGQAQLNDLVRNIESQKTILENLKNQVSDERRVANRRTTAEMSQAKQAKIEARRQEVLRLVKEEMSRSEMAAALGVSPDTIGRDLKALNGQVAK